VNRSAIVLLALSLAGSCALQAQTNPAQTNPLITEARATYNNVKNNLVKAAEKMPEDAYTFKPTPEMQSWGQRIVHIANQIGTCSAMTGERKQSDAGAKEAKADLVAALKASFDACDAAWDSMNDKTAMEMIAGRGGAQRSKLGALIQNTVHDTELYGYLSVYMRLKGVVPPSSDRAN
jgi:uncharacterized damage-inducible protein DinB